MVETRAITESRRQGESNSAEAGAAERGSRATRLISWTWVRRYGDQQTTEHEMNEQATASTPRLILIWQRGAAQAVESGNQAGGRSGDTKRRTKRVKVGKGKYETHVEPGPQAQVALVALDPHTGEVLALVGGRNYGVQTS